MVWLQWDSALVFLQCETVLHACWGKPIFEDIGSGKLSVAGAGTVVRDLGQKLQAWAANPRDALTCEGRRMELVRESLLRLAVHARLGVIFQTMGKRWGGYTREYSAGGTQDVQSSPHPHFLQATPATSVFEESVFGLLSDFLKLGDKKMAPWRTAATSISRQNRAVELPVQNIDLPFISRRAQAVENRHGGSVASFGQIIGDCQAHGRRQTCNRKRHWHNTNPLPKQLVLSSQPPRGKKRTMLAAILLLNWAHGLPGVEGKLPPQRSGCRPVYHSIPGTMIATVYRLYTPYTL